MSNEGKFAKGLAEDQNTMTEGKRGRRQGLNVTLDSKRDPSLTPAGESQTKKYICNFVW